VPDPYSVPSGCAFAPRCPVADKSGCGQEIALVEVGDGHYVRCVLHH
jgi:oligopeptide/dipeptide ABC transporter ATP-binding protein